jgi:hypothetical protein
MEGIMASVLVTIDTPRQSYDLEVPGDVPIGELLPALAQMCGMVPATNTGQPLAWILAGENGTPLQPGRTLINSGVIDGSRLHLHDATAAQRNTNVRTTAPTFI